MKKSDVIGNYGAALANLSAKADTYGRITNRNLTLFADRRVSKTTGYEGGQPTYEADEGAIQYDWTEPCFWVQQKPGGGSAWFRLSEGWEGTGLMPLPGTVPTLTAFSTATDAIRTFTVINLPQRFRLYGFKCHIRSSGVVASTTWEMKARLYEPFAQNNEAKRPGVAISEIATSSGTFVAGASGVGYSIAFRFPEPVVGQGGAYYLYTHLDWATVVGGFPTNTNVESRVLTTGNDDIWRDWYVDPAIAVGSVDPPDEFSYYQAIDDVGNTNGTINDTEAWAFRWFNTPASVLRMQMNWVPIWEALA